MKQLVLLGVTAVVNLLCYNRSAHAHASRGNIQTRVRVAELLEFGSGFDPEFTRRENVHMNATMLGMTKNEEDVSFDDIEAFADIRNFIEQLIKIYSDGMVV